MQKWVKLKIGDIFDTIRGNGLSKDSIDKNGKYECILYGELFTKYKEIIKQVVSKTNIDKGVNSISGDLLLPGSTTTNAEDLAICSVVNKDNVKLGGDINILRDKKKYEVDSNYMAYYLANMKKREISAKAQGTTIVHLYAKDLKDIEIELPPIEEQKAISKILLNVDNIIEKLELQIEQRKLEKKWIMEKIFNKGKSQYEILKNKTWEECKVRDLLELLTDYDANGSFADVAKNVKTYNKQEYAWYVRMTDIENNTPITDVKYVDKQSYEFLKKTKLYGNELLLAKRGDIGKVYIFEMKTQYATLAPNTYLLKVNNKVYPKFLYYYFQSQVGQKSLKRINSATSLGAIYKEDVKKINIKIPTKEEQKEFIKILSNVDKQIKLLQQNNKEYQNLKKGLIQQLLTGKVRVKI